MEWMDYSSEWHDTPQRKDQFCVIQILLASGANPGSGRNSDKEQTSLVNTYVWAQWARRLVPHLQNLGYTNYPDFRDVRRAYPYTLPKYFRRGDPVLKGLYGRSKK